MRQKCRKTKNQIQFTLEEYRFELYIKFTYTWIFKKINIVEIFLEITAMQQLYWLYSTTIKQSYCCFFSINTWIVKPVNKYEFFHYLFMFDVKCNIYNIYTVLCNVRHYWYRYWQTIHLVNKWCRLMISINTAYYCKCIFSYDI